MNLKEKLAELYNDGSKHSRYQNIPSFVRTELEYKEEINEEWRGDTARFQYLQKEIDFGNSRVGDIGANTGFFTLSLAYDNRDAFFTAIEPNPKHSSFIDLIAEHFNINNVTVTNKSVSLDKIKEIEPQDIMLFLNVLHHAGVEFDQSYISNEANFKDYAFDFLKEIKNISKLMVFQMGYNWGGDKSKPIINVDSCAEMIIFLAKLFKETGWKIQKIGLYTKRNGIAGYINMPHYIMEQIVDGAPDDLILKVTNSFLEEINFFEGSEFYKRPIFVVSND